MQLAKDLRQFLLNESDDEYAPTRLRRVAQQSQMASLPHEVTRMIAKEWTVRRPAGSLERNRCLIITYHSSSVLIPQKAGSALFYNIR
jgi:hypothetical protein